MTFAKKIKEKRVEKGLTQRQLAAEVGISQRTIQNYEMGSCVPNKAEIIRKLLDGLELNAEDLTQDEAGFALCLKGQKTEREPIEEEVQKTLESVSGLFAGGRLSEKDKDALIRAILEAYWQSKDQKGQ